MQLHQQNACNGTIYLIGQATPYLPDFRVAQRPRRAAARDCEIFSIAAAPRAAGLPGKLAGELKICLETQLADVNHTGCWDSSYLQIGLQSGAANQIEGG
ncbi:hypothetical protein LGM90_16415 [Burkholderia sp. AU28942]|uniref:hypothetical protein n=1 Tax=Burkholderia TaxID=32008 RepID=UPI00118670E4|nr:MULTISPECIES: hypothetical protein [Burkholderia]MBY4695288.1 hypothetical protein [Burkholderia latens]MCA8310092.1 hypothetical protein [Burkholderia sp. AU28942]QTO45915.1 hypothetical protein J8I85_15615 [Burkholderia latens]